MKLGCLSAKSMTRYSSKVLELQYDASICLFNTYDNEACIGC